MALGRRQARRNMMVGMAIGSSRARRQAATPVQQAAAPQPAAQKSSDDTVTKIRELKQLVDEGILTQEEFEAKKAKLLGI